MIELLIEFFKDLIMSSSYDDDIVYPDDEIIYDDID
jgi:hypothetical protein